MQTIFSCITRLRWSVAALAAATIMMVVAVAPAQADAMPVALSQQATSSSTSSPDASSSMVCQVPAVRRIAGADRYATAVEVAVEVDGLRTNPSRDVFVVSGQNYPDALTAGPPAVNKPISGGIAPVVMVRQNSIPSAVAQFLAGRANQSLHVIGSTGVISEAVEVILAQYTWAIGRTGGVDRYDTAAMLARYYLPEETHTVFIASGTGFADALSGSAYAAQRGGPILLTRPDSLPPSTRAVISYLQPEKIVIFGGVSTVSKSVEQQLSGLAPTVERIAGANRWETNAAILSRYDAVDRIYVVSGQDYPDALAVGPLAGGQNAAVVLTRSDDMPVVVTSQLSRLVWSMAVPTIDIIGGASSVSAAQEAWLREGVYE